LDAISGLFGTFDQCGSATSVLAFVGAFLQWEQYNFLVGLVGRLARMSVARNVTVLRWLLFGSGKPIDGAFQPSHQCGSDVNTIGRFFWKQSDRFITFSTIYH